MKTLIKNVHILTMDEQFSEIKAGYLVIEEDTIVELAPMTTLDEKRMVRKSSNRWSKWNFNARDD